jgi:hypothetical protein
MGPRSALLLAGVTGFLWFHRRNQAFAAGAALALASVKPLVLALLWVALALWVFSGRRWRVLSGGLIAVGLASVVAVMIDPQVFEQYLALYRLQPPTEWASPTMGGLLRLPSVLLGRDQYWLQYVPLAAGVIWLLAYWRRHRSDWDWRVELPLLVAVSLATMPYGWDYDGILALVPVIAVAAALHRALPTARIRVVAIYVGINAAALALNLLHTGAFWFFWLAPALLVWYLWARNFYERKAEVTLGAA